MNDIHFISRSKVFLTNSWILIYIIIMMILIMRKIIFLISIKIFRFRLSNQEMWWSCSKLKWYLNYEERRSSSMYLSHYNWMEFWERISLVRPVYITIFHFHELKYFQNIMRLIFSIFHETQMRIDRTLYSYLHASDETQWLYPIRITNLWWPHVVSISVVK